MTPEQVTLNTLACRLARLERLRRKYGEDLNEMGLHLLDRCISATRLDVQDAALVVKNQRIQRDIGFRRND